MPAWFLGTKMLQYCAKIITTKRAKLHIHNLMYSAWLKHFFPFFSSPNSLFPSAVCVMMAASIYTAQNKSFHHSSLHDGSYGSSYILAWVSFPMTLISGLMYLVLRKRK